MSYGHVPDVHEKRDCVPNAPNFDVDVRYANGCTVGAMSVLSILVCCG